MPIITDELVPLDNKQLRFYDKNGDYIRLSVDEVIARKLNYWNNWYCSAGERSLYIDYDGRVWIANCASSKYYEKEWKKYSHEYVGQYPHKKWYRRKVDGERVIDPTESKEVYLKKFKEYVIRLSEENELRHSMGNNAYEYLKVNFSVDLSYGIIFDHFKHYA